MDYATFIQSKTQLGGMSGFSPKWIPDFLFDFQKVMVEWSIRKGKGALFEECGMGKTPQALVWGENVVRHTNKPVLILTPIAVGFQFIQEAEKFGIEAERASSSSCIKQKKIYVTNYEKIHLFDTEAFAGVVCDESGVLKDMDSIRRCSIIEFMRTRPYRLLCSATPAPNDYVELGNSSEALGELGIQDMMTRFFKKTQEGGHHAWGRLKYSLRPHGQKDFWRWICSWARAIRKPSDLGFPDGDFVLPPLTTEEFTIKARTKRADMMFDVPAVTLQEQREERRRTITERCEMAADLAFKHGGSSILWCHLKDEGDLLEEMIPNSIQISGADDDDEKEEKIKAFLDGTADLVTKPSLCGWGLNLQKCNHQTFFPSHSMEQYYQSVRRSWRFGQTKPVKVNIISSEGESGVLANLQRKSDQLDQMFENLVQMMNNELGIERSNPFTKREEIPSWLS